MDCPAFFQQSKDTSPFSSSLKIPLHIEVKNHFLVVQGGAGGEHNLCIHLVENEGLKRGPDFGDMSGVTHIMEEDQEDSITGSSVDQTEEELVMFWSYILNTLTNLESFALERIFQMLRVFTMQGPSAVECKMQENMWEVIRAECFIKFYMDHFNVLKAEAEIMISEKPLHKEDGGSDDKNSIGN